MKFGFCIIGATPNAFKHKVPEFVDKYIVFKELKLIHLLTVLGSVGTIQPIKNEKDYCMKVLIQNLKNLTKR